MGQPDRRELSQNHRQGVSRRQALRSGGILASLGVAGCQRLLRDPENSSSGTPTATPVGHGVLLWRQSFEGESDSEERTDREVAVTGDTVYVLGDSLWALWRDDGTVRWELGLSSVNDNMPEQIRIYRGTPFLVADDALYGVDTDGPEIAWRGAPEVSTDGEVRRTEYIGAADDTLVLGQDVDDGTWVTGGIDATTGTERWQVDRGNGTRSGVVGAGTVVLPRKEKTFALAVEDGETRWTLDSQLGRLHIANETLYAVETDSGAGTNFDLMAIDISDGTRLWKDVSPENRFRVHGIIPTEDGILATGEDDGEVMMSYDAESGRRNWIRRFEGSARRRITGTTGQAAIVWERQPKSREGQRLRYRYTIEAIDIASGETLWRREFSATGLYFRAVTGSTVLLGPAGLEHDDGGQEPAKYLTVSLDAETGEERWRLDRTRLNAIPGQIENETLYGVDVDGDVFALTL